ncbi:anhydro-N-acetylmuramic acid kinase [Olleya sp. YS]|uniref:anhydro-N-acetylmuramic acid kinase n=1 Tax=Olleya sp. YS TaxID=3028318 RepID=UPI002434325F|nr:anhydro-N-acetylmuramic acid kinase [Olleya sp. YS]WGD35244.1 anhydro-N-acetylmuramic acid kinase [Olleya sp. YS]
MIKTKYDVIGVMSGTSLDGIDLAYISFIKNDNWNFKIIHAKTISYPEHWVKKLKHLTGFSQSELSKIDKDYTNYLAQIINQFIQKHQITSIDAVCSHGHTALHQPQNGITKQIGNLPQLATLVKQTVVCDFRVQDVEFGGQGAPLVPIGDKLLFNKYDWCLNLGGFANISAEINNNRIAFDICPVNIVLNKYVENLGLNYDDKGNIAKSGKLNIQLLNKLNSLSFYSQIPPKSLGLEWVEQKIFPLINSCNINTEDILHTFIKHIAFQITNIINQTEKTSVLTTGGGVFNVFLIDEIQKLTDNQIVIPSNKIIEFKEALIFGFLGVLKLRGETNCLKSVTGALKDHSSGKIFSFNTSK